MQLLTPRDVGAAIRARRRALGWDQSKLADMVGVSRLWVGKVESGNPGASLGLVLRAFQSLGIPLQPGGEGDRAHASAPPPATVFDLDAIVNAARVKPGP